MGTICLTGDVHSLALSSTEQNYLHNGVSEVDLARKYVNKANSRGIKTTLFVTGRAAKAQPKAISEIANKKHVEIGAHTYKSLRPSYLHKLFNVIFQTDYGPKFYQKHDIKRTKRTLEQLVDNIISWRTHGYNSDYRTKKILNKEGFKLISDNVVPSTQTTPSRSQGLINLPINTYRDHGHIYHGNRTPDTVADSPNAGDPFCRDSFSVDEWQRKVRRQIKNIVDCGGIATVQAHPACQYIADDMKAFTNLLNWIESENIPTITCGEVVDSHG